MGSSKKRGREGSYLVARKDRGAVFRFRGSRRGKRRLPGDHPIEKRREEKEGCCHRKIRK